MRRDETGEYKIGRGHLSGIRRNGASAPPIAMAKRLGLRYVAADGLSIRRRRAGKGWSYIGTNGHPIADPKVVRRLTRAAMPPAGCNTAITRVGKMCARVARLGGWLDWHRHCRRCEGASASISRAAS